MTSEHLFKSSLVVLFSSASDSSGRPSARVSFTPRGAEVTVWEQQPTLWSPSSVPLPVSQDPLNLASQRETSGPLMGDRGGLCLCFIFIILIVESGPPYFSRAVPRASAGEWRWADLAVPPCVSGIAGVAERTLIAVKPDGVQKRLIGQIIQRFEQRGFKLVAMKFLKAPEDLLARHYHDLHKKPFYPNLLRYMSSGPVVAMVWEGHNVIRTSRLMVGDTNPAEALPGTVRGDFSVHISRNVVHASDSVDGAQREIQLWFDRRELVDWECCDHSNTYQGRVVPVCPVVHLVDELQTHVGVKRLIFVFGQPPDAFILPLDKLVEGRLWALCPVSTGGVFWYA
ncbi:NDKM protein, partial [Polypterus senegalus]